MNEVSCRVFGVVLDGLSADPEAPARLVDGLPVTVEQLRDSSARVDWPLFVEILRRTEAMVGGPAGLERLGYENLDTSSYAFMHKIASLIARPRDLYWLGTVWFGRTLFTIVEDSLENLPDGRLLQTLEIAEPHDPCPQLFYIIHGALRATPHLVGAADAAVEAEVGRRRVTFTIDPPAARFSFRQMGRSIRWFFQARPMIEQLSDQQRELSTANRELSAALSALKQSDERHRVFSELGSDLCYCFRIVDGHMAPDWISGDLQGLTGYAIEEVGTGWTDLVHVDDREMLARYVQAAVSGDPGRARYRLVSKQGDIRWVEGAMRVETDRTTGAMRILGIVQDVTARELAQQERKRLLTAVDQAGEGIAVLNRRAHVVYANPAFAALMDQSLEEIVGRSVDSLAFGPGDSALLDDMRQVLSEGKVYRGRYVTRWESGEEFTRDATVTPVRDREGKVHSYVSVVHDLTREIEIEGQLMNAQRMDALGRLAGGLAHDFNNVLTVIEGYCDMLLRRVTADSESREPLEMILDAANRGSQLIRGVVAFSRDQRMVNQRFDVNQTIRDVIEILKRVIGSNIELEVALDDPLSHAFADESWIERVLLNLAINARDAMPDGGVLRFETAPIVVDNDRAAALGVAPGEYVVVTVSDSGVGMSDEVRARVFEPFFTTKEVGKGTGLGLASAFGVVRQSGGQIEVRSEIAKGTVFTLFLPTGERADAADSEIRTREVAPAATILVSEGDAQARALARIALIEGGFRVVAVSGAKAALDVLETEDVDMVLTDSSPSIAPDLYQALASKSLSTPLLYMTAPSESDEDPAATLREADVLAKPFKPSQLVARVRRALVSVRVAAPVERPTTDPQ